jgi:predicted thioredoxin/glutaredoxin
MPGPRVLVYTREECGLCDEFIAGLSRLVADFEVRDVDDDPDARRRFGLKVPALTYDGRLVCYGRLDPEAVARFAGR